MFPPALLSKALIYAAEAYHTRGAIRHVVGATQIKWIDASLKTSLSTNDLWVSMIENWGESIKEYEHCKGKNFVDCFLTMCKYMWRVLDAMRLLRERLPSASVEIMSFGRCRYPQYIMEMYLQYKKEGKSSTTLTDDQLEDLRCFLDDFGCHIPGRKDLKMAKFTPECLGKMNDRVNEYNVILATLFAKNPGALLRK